MKHCRILLLLVCTLTLFSGCKKTLFTETHDFHNNTWTRFETDTFEIPVANVDDCYDIYFELLVDSSRVHETSIPIAVNLYSPNSEHRMFRTFFNVYSNGHVNGESEGEYIRISQRVREYFFFNVKGTHRMEVAQCTNKYEVNGIHSITVKVVKSKLPDVN